MYQNKGSYPNVDGEISYSNENNFRGRDFDVNTNRNNFGATANRDQQNMNYNYNRGPGFIGQDYRNRSSPFSNNVTHHKRRNFAPTRHLGARQARRRI